MLRDARCSGTRPLPVHWKPTETPKFHLPPPATSLGYIWRGVLVWQSPLLLSVMMSVDAATRPGAVQRKPTSAPKFRFLPPATSLGNIWRGVLMWQSRLLQSASMSVDMEVTHVARCEV